MSSSLLLPFNTSRFSNTLNPEDRAAQRKALVAPFSEKFDANPEDVLQFIENFTQCCKETGIIEDFNFIIKEKLPLSDVDMDDTMHELSGLLILITLQWKISPLILPKQP